MNKIFGEVYERKTHREFLDFLRRILKKYRDEKLYIILDNLSSHKHKKVKEFLKKLNGRIEFVFLPTNASWLNKIEPDFKDIKRFAINGSNYKSIEEARKAIKKYINYKNKKLKENKKRKNLFEKINIFLN